MISLVVALGHPDRGDDGVAALVADRLGSRSGVVVHRLPGDPSRLLDDPLWTSADTVVVVDAVRTGAPVGSVHHWDATGLIRPGAAITTETHGLGLVSVLALADALGRLPARCTVVGVEGRVFDVGAPPSAEVRGAVDAAVTAVDEVLAAASRQVTAAASAPR